MGASGCSFVYCKNGPNSYMYFLLDKKNKPEGVDKVFWNLFSDQVEVVK